MMGDLDNGVEGLYILTAREIFDLIWIKYNDYQVGVSFFDIYLERAYDLLNFWNECPVRVDANDNVNIVGMKENYVNNFESLISLIRAGLSERVIGKTGMNQNSSRSHAILSIVLWNKETRKKYSKLNFIDLAGNERGSDVTKSTK